MGVSARRRFYAMGRDTGSPGAVSDLSQYLMDVSLSSTRATEYDTTYDPEGKRRFEQTRIALLSDGTLSASGRWQESAHRLIAAARASVLADDQGRGLPFAFGPAGAADGDILQVGTAILTSFSLNFPKTGINDFQLQAQINGALQEATFGTGSTLTARLGAAVKVAGGPLDPVLALTELPFVHGTAGFRTCVLMGGWDASRWLDTFGVNGTVGTTQDGGFRPPGDRQEYLSNYGDHTFSAGGPWMDDYHAELVAYLEAASGQVITLIPGTPTGNPVAGDPALLFQALQTQFDLQGRYDDKCMHSLSLEASDNTAINGVYFGELSATAVGAGPSDGGDTNSLTLGTDPASDPPQLPVELRAGNGIVNVHVLSGVQTALTFVVDSAEATGAFSKLNDDAQDLVITPDSNGRGSGVIQLPATWDADDTRIRVRLQARSGGGPTKFRAAFGI